MEGWILQMYSWCTRTRSQRKLGLSIIFNISVWFKSGLRLGPSFPPFWTIIYWLLSMLRIIILWKSPHDVEFIIDSNFPAPETVKQSQTITFPAPCFRVAEAIWHLIYLVQLTGSSFWNPCQTHRHPLLFRSQRYDSTHFNSNESSTSLMWEV